MVMARRPAAASSAWLVPPRRQAAIANIATPTKIIFFILIDFIYFQKEKQL
jgi:hypothetical protein